MKRILTAAIAIATLSTSVQASAVSYDNENVSKFVKGEVLESNGRINKNLYRSR
jgi:hypothetical protein